MFKRNTYITRGVSNNVPYSLIRELWMMVQSANSRELDYLQIFEITNMSKDGNKMVRVKWHQEQPEYEEEIYLSGIQCDSMKIWIICNGEDTEEEYSTMLLPEEY